MTLGVLMCFGCVWLNMFIVAGVLLLGMLLRRIASDAIKRHESKSKSKSGGK